MPLLEPYSSPVVHRAAMRPDPSTCPVAGKRTNGQPFPRHVRNAMAAAVPTSASATCDALSSLKAFHRLKHHPDPDMHFSSGSGVTPSQFGFSTTRSSYSAPALPPRMCKYDWSKTIPRGMLAGVGTSVPALDRTNEWMTTRNSELDRLDRPRSKLVERTQQAVRQGRSLESWASTATSSFSSSSLLATTGMDAIRSRQAFLMTRGSRQPLMNLS